MRYCAPVGLRTGGYGWMRLVGVGIVRFSSQGRIEWAEDHDRVMAGGGNW